MTVLFAGQVFIFEFKVIELTPEGAALAQIKTAMATPTSTGIEVSPST